MTPFSAADGEKVPKADEVAADATDETQILNHQDTKARSPNRRNRIFKILAQPNRSPDRAKDISPGFEFRAVRVRSEYPGKTSHKINSFFHRMGEGGRRPDEGKSNIVTASCPA
jgi:hypothetical protein